MSFFYSGLEGVRYGSQANAMLQNRQRAGNLLEIPEYTFLYPKSHTYETHYSRHIYPGLVRGANGLFTADAKTSEESRTARGLSGPCSARTDAAIEKNYAASRLGF